MRGLDPGPRARGRRGGRRARGRGPARGRRAGRGLLHRQVPPGLPRGRSRERDGPPRSGPGADGAAARRGSRASRRFRPRSPGRLLHYGWIVVGAAFTVLFLAYGVQYSFGLFFTALTEEFGWSRASLSGVFSLYAAAYSFLGLRGRPAHRPLGTASGHRARRRLSRPRTRAVGRHPGSRAPLRDVSPGRRRDELGVRAVQRDRGPLVRGPPRPRRRPRAQRRERRNVRRPAAGRPAHRGGRLAARVRAPGRGPRPLARASRRPLRARSAGPRPHPVRRPVSLRVGDDGHGGMADPACRSPPLLRAPASPST